jgi:hypothetical protein
VQELTVEGMQARVMSVLESIGAAMPGVGYALGGVIAATVDPRATFLVAGLGVFAIAGLAAAALGTNWPERTATSRSRNPDGSAEVVLELIPAGASRSVPR